MPLSIATAAANSCCDQSGVDCEAVSAMVAAASCHNAMMEVFAEQAARSQDELMADDLLLLLEAYGAVAAQRVIDLVPMVILSNMKSVVELAQGSLESINEAELDALLRESDESSRKRELINQELTTLNAAVNIFHKLHIRMD